MRYFEWDDVKAASNERKHGVSFRDAARVFEDDDLVSEPDDLVFGEVRRRTIGRAGRQGVLFVVYTTADEGLDEFIRLISARQALKAERRRYEQDRKNDNG